MEQIIITDEQGRQWIQHSENVFSFYRPFTKEQALKQFSNSLPTHVKHLVNICEGLGIKRDYPDNPNDFPNISLPLLDE